jgi:AAA domain
MIKEYVDSCTLVKKRTIGVISFIGDEQSRLIRGRLLDRIGPHKFKLKLHDILVGGPPSFQGAERDIVFLSLVGSPGKVITQTQSLHAQRANVALSRARDRMLLVRSFDTNHIPNPQDIQFSILDFFERTASTTDAVPPPLDRGYLSQSTSPLSPFQGNIHRLLRDLLHSRRFLTTSMGVVWQNGICVEDQTNRSERVAICIEAMGESDDEWSAIVQQQRSIEWVGRKCLRVDAHEPQDSDSSYEED